MTLVCHDVRLLRRAGSSRITVRAEVGEFLGVVGCAGSGKSAFARTVAGWVRPVGGEVTLGGRPVAGRTRVEEIGFVADPPPIPRELTGTEWVEYLAAQAGGTARDRAARMRLALEIAHLGNAASARVCTLSRTRLRQLATAAALGCARRVLVLDESLDGVPESVVLRVRMECARRRLIVVLTSGDLGMVTRFANRVCVLSRGKIVAEVPAFELRRRRVVELDVPPAARRRAEILRTQWGDARWGEEGMVVPLGVGRTAEMILAVCREHRVSVRGSSVRPVRVEELGADSRMPSLTLDHGAS